MEALGLAIGLSEVPLNHTTVECFKTALLGKFYWWIFFNIYEFWNNLIKHSISAEFWLIEDYVQGAKELHNALSIEHFDTTTLGKS